MASMLSGLGTLYLLFAFVVLSHALQIGIAVIGAAMTAGLVMLLRASGQVDAPPATPATPATPDDHLPPAERLAVELAEEPSERVPGQRVPDAQLTSDANMNRGLTLSGR